MKIDRLIGILSILLQKERVTAPFLAEKFEVSRRTILRDIDALNLAGIPIVTAQGADGGISIMEGYRIDRTLLTSSDMQAILAGLRSLDSVCGTTRYQQLMEKLSAGNSSVLSGNNHILIDLSSWYRSSLEPKISLIQKAVEEKRLISFHYYSPNGEAIRTIEPYFLLFRWSSWYVWGYCRLRLDFRMFKINRIENLSFTGEIFDPRPLTPPSLDNKTLFPPAYHVKAVFHPSVKWRLIDEYGSESFTVQPDGSLLFQFGFMDKESLFGWILSFGPYAELLEPKQMREELRDRLKAILNIYGIIRES